MAASFDDITFFFKAWPYRAIASSHHHPQFLSSMEAIIIPMRGNWRTLLASLYPGKLRSGAEADPARLSS